MDKHNSSVKQLLTKDRVPVEIQHPDLVTSIKIKMESISSSHSICRVKAGLREANKSSYIPDKVSIGPYHHGMEALKPMEDQKWHYLCALLNRKPNLEAWLDDCVTSLKEVEQRARGCYKDEISISSHEFLQIMLVDGCFIIELFLKYSVKTLRRRNDPIFITPGMLFDLRSNLILLENQIPLFVLQRLFQVLPIPEQCSFSLAELAFRFFRNMIPGNQKANHDKFNQEGNHFLDLICHCLLPTVPRVLPKRPNSGKQQHCVAELEAAGVRLRPARTDHLLDMKFRNGVLEIPQILVHQYTESLFRNLIALEQFSCDHVQHITSYAFLMKSLICSDRDVKLLRKQGILVNYDANERDTGKLFEKLCEDVSVKEFYYEGLCEKVNGYKGTDKWHVCSNRLKAFIAEVLCCL